MIQRDFGERRLSIGDMQLLLGEEVMPGVQRRLGRVASVVEDLEREIDLGFVKGRTWPEKRWSLVM